MTGLHRRRALHLLGAGAGTALLAGCSETSDENGDDEPAESTGLDLDGELPSYASHLPETERAEYFYGAIDLATMHSLLDGDAEAGDEPSDPLLGNPIVVALYCSYAISLLGGSNSADAYLEHNETDDGDETFVYANGVYAFVGSYAATDLGDALADAGYVEESDAEGYAVYADPASGEVVGVAESVFAFSYPSDDADPIEAVERAVAAAAGGREPNHETDDDFAALLRAGESDGITLCLYTADEEFDEETLTNDGTDGETGDPDGLNFAFDAVTGASGIHQRLSIADHDVDAQATAIVTYSSEDRVDEARLESALGTDADAVSVDRDDTTVRLEAEYEGDVVDE